MKKKYFRVGISGHRDLQTESIPTYLQEIKNLLSLHVEMQSDKELLVVSPLADGADRLIVRAAQELGLRYEVLLPMKVSLYEKDFNDASYREFNKMLLNARSYKVIPLYNNEQENSIEEYGKKRDLQYREVGRELVRSMDSMIFLYDGIDNSKIGGTSDILNYAKSKNTPYEIITCKREKR